LRPTKIGVFDDIKISSILLLIFLPIFVGAFAFKGKKMLNIKIPLYNDDRNISLEEGIEAFYSYCQISNIPVEKFIKPVLDGNNLEFFSEGHNRDWILKNLAGYRETDELNMAWEARHEYNIDSPSWWKRYEKRVNNL